MIGSSGRLGRRLLAIGETVAALLVAVVLTAVLSLPFLPWVSTIEFALEPRTGGSAGAVPPDELARRIESGGLAERAQRAAGRRSRLVLTGIADRERTVKSLAVLLEESGYEPVEPRFGTTIEREGLLRETAPLTLTLQVLAFTGIGLLLIRLRVRRERPTERVGAGANLLLGVGGGAAAFGLSVVLGLVLQGLGFPPEEQEWIRELLGEPGVLLRLAPWIVVFAPLAEEVFFRGYVFRFLRQRIGLPTALFVSSALFALVHFNPSGMLIYLGIGAVLALVYSLSTSLLAPVLAHMTHNAAVLAVSLLAGWLDAAS